MKRIAILGHSGMLGSALVRRLQKEKEDIELIGASSNEVDLCDVQQVSTWFKKFQPNFVFVAAARVGGIGENIQFPVEFLGENALIALHTIMCAQQYGVEKLVYLGSSCLYPAQCEQPMSEDMILTGPFEPTNEGYAIGKLVGMKLAEYYRKEYNSNFITVLPCNLYGPGDDWTENGHVLASLVRKISDAKKHNLGEVILWGTGNPRRAFLHVDDCADACVLALKKYSETEPLNIGSGVDLSIHELAILIAAAVKYEGKFIFNKNKPDGMQQKLLDVTRLDRLSWAPRISLEKGIKEMVHHYHTNN